LKKRSDRSSDKVTGSGRLERPLVSKNRMMGDKLKDQVILLSAFGEVLPSVVNHVVCAQ
jgi:hypothetical protein